MKKVVGILKKMYRKKTGRKEWALVSRKNPKKVLKWFGPKKPSKEEVAKEERRVQYWKHVKGSVDPIEIRMSSVLKFLPETTSGLIEKAKRSFYDYVDYIPRTNAGKPKDLKKAFPVGVGKEDKQAKVWKKVVSVITKRFTRTENLEDKWLVCLMVYSQVCNFMGLPPFPESTDKGTGRNFTSIESQLVKLKAERFAAEATQIAEELGINKKPNSVKFDIVESTPYAYMTCNKACRFVCKWNSSKLPIEAIRQYTKRIGGEEKSSLDENLVATKNSTAFYLGRSGSIEFYITSDGKVLNLQGFGVLPATTDGKGLIKRNIVQLIKRRFDQWLGEKLVRR